MKPKLNVNFNLNIATLVLSDGYAVTMTYNELQEIYKLLKDTFEDIKQLKAENERLKSIVESNNQQVEQAELLVMDNDRLQQEVENLKDTIYYDVEKYRQALQEIKDIADRTDGNHPASVINMVSVIRHTINSVIGAEE